MNFDHIAIKVNNIQESIDWYKENVKVEVLYQDETWCLLKAGGAKVAFVLEDMHPPHLCFEVDKETKQELELKHQLSFKSHRDGSEYIYVKDNCENFIEFLYWPNH